VTSKVLDAAPRNEGTDGSQFLHGRPPYSLGERALDVFSAAW
jgi:hypothetical protein